MNVKKKLPMKLYVVTAGAVVLSLFAFLFYQTGFLFHVDQRSNSIEANTDAQLENKLFGRNKNFSGGSDKLLIANKEKLHATKQGVSSGAPKWTKLKIERELNRYSESKKAAESALSGRVKVSDNPEVLSDLLSLGSLNSNGTSPRTMRDSAGKIRTVSGSFTFNVNRSESSNIELEVADLIKGHSNLFAIGDDESTVLADLPVALSSGETVLRLNREYKGLPVWGKQIVATVFEGQVKTITGDFRGIQHELDLSSKLSKAQIEQLASSDMSNSGYPEAQVLDTEEGIYFMGNIPSHAFKVSVQVRHKKWELYFSPTTENLIAKRPLFYNVSTSSSGRDLTGAERVFQSDFSSSRYVLEDNTFPSRTSTSILDWNGNEPNFKPVSSTSSNRGWDPAGVSGWYNASLTYKYFWGTHQRDSYDGKSGEIVAIVNRVDRDGIGVDNASWGDGQMFYGAGTTLNNFAISLDVAAHEFSHGVVEHSSNLAYRNESGALNESFADFFGVMVDRDDWKIGEQLFNSTGFLRDLKNPGSTGQPAHWRNFVNLPSTAEGDWGGVHINSGIQNRALYLIAEGLTDEGLGVSIGKVKTEQLVYKTLLKLQSDAKFIDSANTMILEAEKFGAASEEAIAVKRAWELVGVTSENISSTEGGINSISMPTGDDLLVHLYPRDGSMDNLFSEEYDLYVQTINLPFRGHLPSLEYGPLNDVAASGSKPTISTSSSGTTWIEYIGSDKKIRTTSLRNIGADILLNTPDIAQRAISIDDSKTALVQINSNKIFICSRTNGFNCETITVEGPNYSQGSTSTAVSRVDAINFDSTGNKIIFDYEVCRTRPTGSCVPVWSIGLYDLVTKAFSFPFPNTDVSIDVGFPRFANTNDYVIAFDYLDSTASESTSLVLIYDLLRNETLSGLLTNVGEARTSAWGIPSFVGNDEAIALQAQGDTSTSMYHSPLDENYNTVGKPTYLTPFDSGLGQAHRNAYLNITSSLEVDKKNSDFGTVLLGGSATVAFTISNKGNRKLVVTASSFSRNALSSNLTNGVILAGERRTFEIRIDPDFGDKGLFAESMTIEHTGDNSSVTLGVSGFLDIDTDLDGIGNTVDIDDDGDGLTDADEARIGTNPLLVDTDGDGIGDNFDAAPLDPTVQKIGSRLPMWLLKAAKDKQAEQETD